MKRTIRATLTTLIAFILVFTEILALPIKSYAASSVSSVTVNTTVNSDGSVTVSGKVTYNKVSSPITNELCILGALKNSSGSAAISNASQQTKTIKNANGSVSYSMKFSPNEIPSDGKFIAVVIVIDFRNSSTTEKKSSVSILKTKGISLGIKTSGLRSQSDLKNNNNNQLQYNGTNYSQRADEACWIMSYAVGETVYTKKNPANPVNFCKASDNGCNLIYSYCSHLKSGFTTYSGNASLITIYNELLKGNPVAAVYSNSHMVVIYGVNAGVNANNLSLSSFKIYDPWDGTTTKKLNYKSGFTKFKAFNK